MGRTNPTYRDSLSGLEREWGEFRRALRHEEQAHFDRLFEEGRSYAHAASHCNHPTPAIPLLLSMLLAHERRLAALEADATDAQDDEPAAGARDDSTGAQEGEAAAETRDEPTDERHEGRATGSETAGGS